jgi:hypothetical protein
MGRRGLAPATREAYGRFAGSYLVLLEARGIAVLDGAGQRQCAGVFGIPTGPVGQVVAVFAAKALAARGSPHI